MRLIDADALRADYFVTSTTTNNPLYRYVSMEQIANAPTVEPASSWHRVEEPPKENGKYVAINVKTNWWYEASYENGNWKAVDLFCQRWVVIHPTHWMPIEPPKEDAR